LTVVKQIRSWFETVVHRDQFEGDLDDEMQLHIALRADDIERSGVPRGEAERRARIEFGGAQAHKEDVRRSRGLAPIDGLWQDLHFVARSLRRNLLLSLAVIATLSLTIGMTTGVFTLLEAVALRPRVDHDQAAFFRVYVAYRTDADRFPKPGAASLADFVAYRATATSARAMTAYFKVSAPLDATQLVNSRFLAVTCDFFSVYRPPRPLLGRPLQPADCERAERVIVLGETAWRERYGADPSIVGKTIRVNDHAVTVVGVLPVYDGQVDRIDAWMPYTVPPALGLGMDLTADPTLAVLSIDGLARPGRTRRNVAAEVAAAAAQQDVSYAKRHSGVRVTNGSLIEAPASRPLVIAAFGVVVLLLGFVVVIACTNVTTLLLSRAEARRQEVAVRLAIGASRSRLLRLMLTETAVLAVLAAAGGVWFAYSIPPLLVRMLNGQRLGWSLNPDWLAFAWLAVATLLAGAAAGLAPALGALNMSLVDALKAGGSQSSSRIRRGKRRGPVYGRLITVQLALSLVLLAGGYLFYRSYQRLANLNVGHATRDLVTVSLFDRDRAKPQVGGSLRTTVRSRLLAVPGVRRVAFANALPSTSQPASDGVTANGVRRLTTQIETSAAFFETAGIRLVRGQSYGDAEPACASGGCSVVVSQEMARQLFGGRDPLGATVATDSGAVMRVVGVAADVSNANGAPGPLPIVYEPWDPAPQRPGYIALVRFSGKEAGISAAIAAALRQTLSDASVGVENVQALIDRNVEVQRQLATIISAFALLAVVLAMIGIHGVVSFSVRRQTKELGVRIALGATSRDIYVAVARGYARPIVAGMVGGMLIAVPTAVFVQRGLTMVPILDRGSSASFAVAALAMLLVIVLAIVGPARRAGVINPLTALRAE
jgi:putative ABC transport system permease protein